MIWGKRNLKKIAQEAVCQGDHKRKIVKFYTTLIQEARKEFKEDNTYMLDTFLRDCHEEALAVPKDGNAKSWYNYKTQTI